MADVFVSYSHKDTDFIRDLVAPLEAEGFSVWWDHTIPPGKTWDEVIARGIREAKACIIVWTPNSIESDWVKEEATIAKEGGKYLPIQLGVEQPPLGFRRIQSAELSRWRGNPQDPQWRLLVQEIASLVGVAKAAMPSAAAAPPPTGRPAGGGHRHRTGLILGATAGGALIIGGALVWGFWYSAQPRSVGAPAATYTNQAASIVGAPAVTNTNQAASILGVWQGWYHLDSDAPGLRTPLTGTFNPDGGMMGQSGGRTTYWHWQQNGSNAQWTNGGTTYSALLTGNHMSGTISYSGGSGVFEADR